MYIFNLYVNKFKFGHQMEEQKEEKNRNGFENSMIHRNKPLGMYQYCFV